MRTHAPDYATVYQVENYVSAAVAALLDDESTPAHDQRTVSSVETPCYTVQVVGSRMTEHNAILPGRRPRRDTWELTVAVTAVTNRTESQSDGAVTHEEMVGTIREVMHGWAESFTESQLPYHEVLDCVESGSSVGTTGEKDQDITTVTFDLTVAIAATAWPV